MGNGHPGRTGETAPRPAVEGFNSASALATVLHRPMVEVNALERKWKPRNVTQMVVQVTFIGGLENRLE